MSSTHPNNPTLAIFTGPYAGPSTIEHIESLINQFPDLRIAIFQQTRTTPPLRRRIRTKLKRLRKQPLSYPLELITESAARLATTRKPKHQPDPNFAFPANLQQLAQQHNLIYHATPSLHNNQTLQLIRDLNPTLGLALAAPILKRPLFSIPKQGTINLHKSCLPNYKGMPPGFWELHDNAETTGVTVHEIDDSLDTGRIIHQQQLTIQPFTTPRGLALQIDQLASQTLPEAIGQLLTSTAQPIEQPLSASPPNSRPAYLTKRRIESHRQANRKQATQRPAPPKRIVKQAVFTAYAKTIAPLRNATRSNATGCHTTVLLYHRVSDEFIDNVTVGVEQFEQQMSFLAARYQIVSLDTMLAERNTPLNKPRVVITFDDGYADNYLAALILRRLGIPATFYISTAIVGTDRPFAHDTEKIGRAVPTLTWKQIEQMHGWGFTIANHTAHHTDCGTTPADLVLSEIAHASSELNKRLGPGCGSKHFAFPFGRPEHIQPAVVQALPEIGIDSCASAHGGINHTGFDPYNILRCGIEAAHTLASLNAIIEGWRQPESGEQATGSGMGAVNQENASHAPPLRRSA